MTDTDWMELFNLMDKVNKLVDGEDTTSDNARGENVYDKAVQFGRVYVEITNKFQKALFVAH